ncbi:U3 small nucleolar ribonucleoprotein complex, subunit Mpp10 [Tricladium varicosporioides]|nr:U3 small nucleolar ribonucleoprotein complex, subunit Mpp10 [Hymenoscyphus varicosporioides]
MATTSTTSSMTSTSHTLTAFPPSATLPSFSSTFLMQNGTVMADLLAALQPERKHGFLIADMRLRDAGLRLVKGTLDAVAGKLGEEQVMRLKENRRKRKRGESGGEEEVLKIRRVHTEGFEVGQVWEQARRVVDALRVEAERVVGELEVNIEDGIGSEDDSDGGSEVEFDEDGFDVGSQEEGEEESEDDERNSRDEEAEFEMGDEDDAQPMIGFNGFEGIDDLDDEEDNEKLSDEDEEAGVFIEDPNGLNDGFFSIDEFNKQTEFLERADAAADMNTGEASDEEDIDWDADPLTAPAPKVSSSRRAAAMDISDVEDGDDDDSEDGPTFGNVDLNAPEGESDEEDEDVDMDEGEDAAGDNTNDILYKDFFEPPPRKAGKGERQANYLERQSRKSLAENLGMSGADVERAMADVKRDLFDDLSDQEGSGDALSDVDPADPRSRRSKHERQQAKLKEEIRKLEAASVAKREWTLSGEARAADRPQNSLLEEDLDFERTGKPVPVITAEVSESIEELIKRRILAQEFDEVIRRRPDSLNNPTNSRRGAFELDDTKPQQSLAEMYEEEHVKANNPDTYVSKADEKVRKEEKEIEALWRDVSAKLDALSSWHYKPKPAAPSLTVVADVATVSMEDAQPSTAAGINGGESMLAPQEIYKAGKEKENIEKGEVVPKSGAPIARQEMTREEKLRRRRREKERIKKRGGEELNQRPEGRKAKGKREMIEGLKKGGVRVIGKKGEIRDVEGNKVQATKALNGAGGFKL